MYSIRRGRGRKR